MLLETLGRVADESLLLLFLVLFVLFVAATELGFRVGRRVCRSRTADETQRSGVGFVVGGMLGLLAFLLGISLSLAESRHSERRLVVLNEANAIGTAWLRAGTVEGEAGERLQRLVADYAALRLRAISELRDRAEAARLAAETQAMQDRMWEKITAVVRASPTPVSGLLMASFNDMFDLATAQRQFFTERVPAHILRLLLWTSLIAVGAMGYNFGIGGSRQLVMSSLLLVLWCSAMVLIVDINRPGQGFVTISTAPLEWQIQSFGQGLGPPR